MPVTDRPYDPAADFDRVHAFLTSLYRPDNLDGNWFAPTFEYAVTHPFYDEAHQDRFRLWLDDGRLVAFVCYELYLGEAFFAVAPGYERLLGHMLDHAEAHLTVEERGGRRLNAFVFDQRPAWLAELAARGYQRQPGDDRPMARMPMPDPFPEIVLPPGFRLTTLADENNLAELSRVLHRGFGHGDEPDPATLAEREKMQTGPHYRLDLQVAVVAPDGHWVAFCGMWYDAVNRFGYVEPVCSDPDYRRLGLGTAAVMEGVRRCGELGADRAYVGSTRSFYQAMGFEYLHRQECWRRVG